jgi:hypothetical protein
MALRHAPNVNQTIEYATIPNQSQSRKYLFSHEPRQTRSCIRPADLIKTERDLFAAAMEEMYKLLLDGGVWPGEPLLTENGHPRLHDILDRLNIERPIREDTPYLNPTPSNPNMNLVNLPETEFIISESEMARMSKSVLAEMSRISGMPETSGMPEISRTSDLNMYNLNALNLQHSMDVLQFPQYAEHLDGLRPETLYYEPEGLELFRVGLLEDHEAI